jgi:hypothetical protein
MFFGCSGVLLCSVAPCGWHIVVETCSDLKNCIFLSRFVGGCLDQVAVLPETTSSLSDSAHTSLTNHFNKQFIVNYHTELDTESVNTKQTLAGWRQRWYDPEHVMLSNVRRA